MAFYIKPPEGNISLSRLYEDAETRLLFLCEVHQCCGSSGQIQSILVDHPSIASNSECLIEGSRKDRISHFVLRLVCQESEHFRKYFTEAETHLFDYRLKSGGESTMVHSVSDLKRHSGYALKHMKLTSSHREVMLQVQKMSSEILSSGMVECSMRISCHHIIKVPWTMVIPLVKERNVAVISGEELHKILSSTSRLRHHARIRYTLFLKDIGLPVMENLALWESFYSKAHRGTGCSHSWEGCDRSRYTYGIRHLYGMEGGRTNYTSHSCSSLQALWSQPSETGGCPFTSFDEERLSYLLSPILGTNIHIQETIMKEVKAKRPYAACKILLAFTVFMQREYKRRQEYEFNELHGQKSLKDLDKVESDRQSILKDGENSSTFDSNEGTLLPKECEEQSSFSFHVCKNQMHPNDYDCSRKHEKVKTHLKVSSLLCLKEKDTQNSQKAYVSSCRCSGMKNQFHSMLCDLEDLRETLPECNFLRPSQYYLKAKSKSDM
ncbi:uncharacterized protein [Panulirus ornatus]|uniref:uncharacterized protein isoform X2 n=1 Tax=Panulirus ornatus TaxID=150431 RepID=UPI003A860792